MPLIRDVIVGFLGFRRTSPLADDVEAPLALALALTFDGGGLGGTKWESGWVCDDALEIEGAGETPGFAAAFDA
jgi:hypothetical protein